MENTTYMYHTYMNREGIEKIVSYLTCALVDLVPPDPAVFGC